MITHVLDTSALLAHYLREPGAEDVQVILARGPEETGVSLITLVELRGRLTELVADLTEAERAFKLYTETLTTTLPFTRQSALFHQAMGSRRLRLRSVGTQSLRHAAARPRRLRFPAAHPA